jgi:hypothetical protein
MAKRFEVPGTFTIPDTIEGVMGLLTARGWERAAIVYAYTKPSKGGRPPKNSRVLPTVFPCTYTEFSAFGISGLKDQETVAFYREQWVAGIENGWAEMVGPGDTIDVPDMPFPAVGHDREPTEAEEQAAEEVGVSAKQVARAAANPKVIKAAVKSKPELADQVAEDLPAKAFKAAIKKDPVKTRVAREAVAEVDYGRDLDDARTPPREDDPYADQAALLIRMRLVRSELQAILGWTINLRGRGSNELREGVVEEVTHWRSYINAIEEAAQGRSLDAEIEKLLAEEAS